jgi:type IV secretory pathway VirB2 component (pilin)
MHHWSASSSSRCHAKINSGLAQSKGRSGLLWWLISLLFGPIATFLIVVFPKVEDEPLP